MISNLILDYDDMVKVGSIQPDTNIATPPTDETLYAVIIKTAKAKVGKFNITSKEDVKHSILAINKNADIPDVVKKTAMYHIKQAAIIHDIEVDWDVEKTAYMIDEKDIPIKSISQQNDAIKIANTTYPLNGIGNIKEAEDVFLAYADTIEPLDRINMSRLIVKNAAYTPYIPKTAIKLYARAQFGNKVQEELDLRKIARPDSLKFIEAIDKLASSYEDMGVPDFLELIQNIDKAAGYDPQRHGTDYCKFLMTTNPRKTVDIDKLAVLSITKGDEELASLIV